MTCPARTAFAFGPYLLGPAAAKIATPNMLPELLGRANGTADGYAGDCMPTPDGAAPCSPDPHAAAPDVA